MLFIAALLAVCLAAAANAQQKGWMSRYWDGCKPNCSWVEKAQHIPGTICKNCDINDNEIDATGDNPSSCDGGNAYTCWDMSPFADPNDPNKAYGFAATPGTGDQCGKCFEIVFDGGFQHHYQGNENGYAPHAALKNKVLIVMSSNIGHDVSSGQFDLLVPGGGVGQFDSFSNQLGINVSDLGERYGGFLSDCEKSVGYDGATVLQFQTCLRNKCNSVFGDPKHALLKDGCNFYADWFMAAGNPTLTYKEVECPQVLVDKYKEWSGKNTRKVQAVDFTSKTGNFGVSGIISGTSNGDIAVYELDSMLAGEYTLEFRIATGMLSTFKVFVNGTEIEEVICNPGDWGTYRIMVLDSPIFLNAGKNTVEVRFGGPINMDFFRFRGVEEVVSVKHTSSAKTVRFAHTPVKLKAGAGGFTATLSPNHGYTSYKIVDLRGREVRSGAIRESVTDLRFNNLSRGVLFLQLFGKEHGKPAVARVVTY
jgi:hypothetical protein